MLLLVSVYLIHFLFDLIAVPLSLLLCFYFAVYRIRIRCPCPCLPSWVVLRCLYDCYTFLAYPVEEDVFLAVRMLYGCFLFLSSAFFVFVFVSCFCFFLFFCLLYVPFWRRCPLLATFLSASFGLLSLLFFSDHVSGFDLVWFRLSCEHDWIRSGSVGVR